MTDLNDFFVCIASFIIGLRRYYVSHTSVANVNLLQYIIAYSATSDWEQIHTGINADRRTLTHTHINLKAFRFLIVLRPKQSFCAKVVFFGALLRFGLPLTMFIVFRFFFYFNIIESLEVAKNKFNKNCHSNAFTFVGFSAYGLT